MCWTPTRQWGDRPTRGQLAPPELHRPRRLLPGWPAASEGALLRDTGLLASPGTGRGPVPRQEHVVCLHWWRPMMREPFSSLLRQKDRESALSQNPSIAMKLTVILALTLSCAAAFEVSRLRRHAEQLVDSEAQRLGRSRAGATSSHYSYTFGLNGPSLHLSCCFIRPNAVRLWKDLMSIDARVSSLGDSSVVARHMCF